MLAVDDAAQADTIDADTLNKLVRAASHCPRHGNVTTNSVLITVATANGCVTESMLDNATPLLKPREGTASRRSHVWCKDSHGSTCTQRRPGRRGVLAETQTRQRHHVHTTTATTRRRKHHRRPELALCHHVTLDIVAHGSVTARHPRYTRSQYAEKSVGGSTSTAHTHEHHALVATTLCFLASGEENQYSQSF